MGEIQRLRDRVDELEQLLGLREEFPPEWHLTPTERALLGMLVKRQAVNLHTWLAAHYGGRADPPSSECSLSVYVLKLRRKLAWLPIEIAVMKGDYGCRNGAYFLTAANKRAIAAAIARSPSVHHPITD